MAVCGAIVSADETPKEFVPRGTVVDANHRPIIGAEITLHRWDGVMSPALETTATDHQGRFAFRSRPEDAYYYVVIRQAPYAPIDQIVGAEGPIEATLRPAVDAWVEVRSAAGEPLQGARITSLSIRTEQNTQTYVWRGMEHLLGFEFTASDDAGRLDLPPLPDGAVVDLRIDHPRWAQTKLANATVHEGRLDSVALSAGVMTTLEFVADPRTPLALDGLICETSLLGQSSSAAGSLSRIPMTVAGNRITFCAHPATYESLDLKAAGMAITPQFYRLSIETGAEKKLRFLVRKTVNVAGRVVHADGTPHRGAEAVARIENLSPDGPIAGAPEWTYGDRAETDEQGNFTLALPPGRSRIKVYAEGFVTDRDEIELKVRADAANEIPNFVTTPLPSVRGRIVDAERRPVPGAIVRLRHPSMLGRQPEVSDADGRFEIALPQVPTDPETDQRSDALDVAAFVTDRPLMGVARIDLRRPESLDEVDIRLGPDPSADALVSLADNRWVTTMRENMKAEREANRPPAGNRGQPAPELDGVAWYHTDARGLRDFRGRYVLLDFWFTGCGPCHGDFPSVKLIHERFEKLGVTVIGVHDNSSSPEAVLEHCRQQGLVFPIVVDHQDGRILRAYRQLGVRSFPTYLLIGPDGNILENGSVTDGPPLRVFKLEVIRRYLLHAADSP
ncbi:MAG TPA: redoxin domain-containing protein [Pirellulales bacterium]|nr:redoxin domain-containing protein [Pirellulales bacterium]